MFAVFVQRRGANRMKFAASQHRLEHVGGVHRTFGCARAHKGVHFVNEQQDLAVGVLDFVQNRLEPLLEFAAVLGPGDQRAQVQRHQPLILQRRRHVAVDDALRQTLGDGSLAHARLADQHRVVLGAATEDLHDPADLLIAPDDWVQVALARLGGQVAPVLDEGFVLGFRGVWLVTRWLPRTLASPCMMPL